MARTNTGGAGGSWTPDGVTTATVGGIPAGTDLGTDPTSVEGTLLAMLYPFAFPLFTSFGFTQTSPVEVGTTISGSKSFAWAFNIPANVQPNTMDIIDVTAGNVYLETNITTTSPFSTNIGTLQFNIPTNYSWRGSAQSTTLVDFFSALFTVKWQYRLFYGTSLSTTLNEAGIEGLANNPLKAGFAGAYSFVAGDYKYFAWPDSFGSPSAAGGPGTGFWSGLFNVAMASAAEDPFYSNVQNGWSYGLVSVTNAFAVNTNYRVYRTKNTLGGAITINIA